MTAILLTAFISPLETSAATETLIEAATVDVLDRLVIETQDRHDESLKLILTRRVETIERGNEKIGIPAETHVMIEHGTEIGVAEAIMVIGE